MPTHVHLLIYPTDRSITLGPVLSTIKQSVAKRARLHFVEANRPFPASMTDTSPRGTRVFRFWQRGAGYDRNITNAETARKEIRYIHRNPVKAGLCTLALDYEWSSARAFKDPAAGPLPLDLESLPRN